MTVVQGTLLDEGGELFNVTSPQYRLNPDGSSRPWEQAVHAAMAALPTEGGVVYLPQGVYPVTGYGIIPQRSRVTVRGAGMWNTVLRRSGTNDPIVQSSGVAQRLVFEDLCFDYDAPTFATGVSVVLSGQHVTEVVFRRCRFTRIAGYGLALARTAGVTVEDCLFDAPGNGVGTGISLTGGTRDIRVVGCTFRYVDNGIIADTGDESNDANAEVVNGLEVTGCTFDMGWWLLVAAQTGGGAGVTYTATTLTDTARNFTGLAPQPFFRNVRVLEPQRTAAATISGTRLYDPGASFTAYSLIPGEIVRCGGAFGVIENVESDQVLWVEEWLSDADRSPVPAPASGTYTVSRLWLGLIESAAGNTLTVGRWHDLNGNHGFAPPAGTPYEILVQRNNYPVHAERNARNVRIAGNRFRRGWSDQISVYGNEVQIVDNLVELGQDMGITLHGRHNVVAGNRVRRQGAGGIWLTCSDSVVTGNVAVDSPWVNPVADGQTGDIILAGGSRNRIAHNHCERRSVALGYYGLRVVSDAPNPSEDNWIEGNTSRGHHYADILLDTEHTRRTRLRDNAGTLNVRGAVDTDAAGTRVAATLTFPPIAAGAHADVSVSVPGASAVNAVVASTGAVLGASLVWSAFVSGPDTVVVRLRNVGTPAASPPAAPWTVALV